MFQERRRVRLLRDKVRREGRRVPEYWGTDQVRGHRKPFPAGCRSYHSAPRIVLAGASGSSIHRPCLRTLRRHPDDRRASRLVQDRTLRWRAWRIAGDTSPLAGTTRRSGSRHVRARHWSAPTSTCQRVVSRSTTCEWRSTGGPVPSNPPLNRPHSRVTRVAGHRAIHAARRLTAVRWADLKLVPEGGRSLLPSR